MRPIEALSPGASGGASRKSPRRYTEIAGRKTDLTAQGAAGARRKRRVEEAGEPQPGAAELPVEHRENFLEIVVAQKAVLRAFIPYGLRLLVRLQRPVDRRAAGSRRPARLRAREPALL